MPGPLLLSVLKGQKNLLKIDCRPFSRPCSGFHSFFDYTDLKSLYLNVFTPGIYKVSTEVTVIHFG